MKIVFVYLGAESLAIESLSAVLKKDGFSVSLVFDPGLFDDKQYLNIPALRRLSFRPDYLADKVAQGNPDLVCFSCVTDMYEWAGAIARLIKQRSGAPIIFGGIHPSSVPEEVIKEDFVDMLCVGEGEEALLELCRSLRDEGGRKGIANIWFKQKGQIIRNPPRPLQQDLDCLPFPDKGLFAAQGALCGKRYMLMTSRGCPYSCTYCYNDVYRRLYPAGTKFLRQRSVGNVIAELVFMKEKLRFSSVEFMDDLFTADSRWFSGFAEEYKRQVCLPYQCMSDAHAITVEKARILKESGCTRVKFGVQTVNQRTRKDVLNRFFESQEEVENALAACGRAGLDYSLDHIIGIPGENERDWRDTARFYSRTNAKRVNCYSMAYFPRTRIAEIAREKGMISPADFALINQGRQRLYVLGSFLSGRQLNLYRAYRNFYALMPWLGRRARLKLLDSHLFACLRFIPGALIFFLEFLAALKTGHLRGLDFARYYARHLLKLPCPK